MERRTDTTDLREAEIRRQLAAFVETGGLRETEIRRQLAAIVESVAFRGSKRCHDFLVFVVNKTLAGDVDCLKERTLAVEVFGRKTDTALGDDSIVRVGAREVRKRLAQYYLTEGAEDQLRIDLPSGSYVPNFHLNPPSPKLAEPEPLAAEPAIPRRQSLKFLRWLAPLVAVASLFVVFLLVRNRTAQPPSDFEVFWQPVFSQASPILIGLAHPLVYHPSDRLARLDEDINGQQQTLQRPVSVSADVKPNDYVPVFDQYVGFGDAIAATKLALLLSQHGRTAKLRLASKVDFADLRDSPTILVGAFTNRWATEIVKNLRFRFERRRGLPWIVDSASGRKWLVEGKTDNGKTQDDYILLCRLPNIETGKMLLIGAGLTQYGTQEAGRILSDSEALTPILHKLPSNWRERNVQIVLHAQVVGDTPTAPELIASYVW